MTDESADTTTDGTAQTATTDDGANDTRATETADTAAPGETDAADPALVVEDLTVAFGDLIAVDDVSFAVAPDTVTCLVGPNGSGKTTLIRAIADLVGTDHGSVERPESATRPVGYLPQAPAFRPQFTVAETLQFYADLTGEAVDVDATVERVGLGGVPDRRVDALSGGMTRLLGIAQATVGDPPLVLLDEPSSGLDPMMTRHVSDVITDLAAGAAVLVTSHDLSAVERIADQVLVLDRGRIVAADSPAGLMASTDTDDLASAMSELVAIESGQVATRGEGVDG
ncbi:ABC transporter ATP-binding protein [Halorientalis regularis]|jgi:ABC-type multidrug transport system ATPase subunit|uniref:ABC-type multidrug transport system, ATPase component n=1 Tax=Halorientalis regularis TaxID=660518 RepID=A0A1G7FP38_9EURY|nr:ABC transporter ATP-binding protein [Halorientalis regularis]SDE77656.1 ABC-type multidrug transport system, ATPase component [Halorientalis regularis]